MSKDISGYGPEKRAEIKKARRKNRKRFPDRKAKRKRKKRRPKKRKGIKNK